MRNLALAIALVLATSPAAGSGLLVAGQANPPCRFDPAFVVGEFDSRIPPR